MTCPVAGWNVRTKGISQSTGILVIVPSLLVLTVFATIVLVMFLPPREYYNYRAKRGLRIIGR